MVRQDKSKSRITPKGTAPKSTGAAASSSASGVSRQPVNIDGPSPLIVPIIMFGSLILGVGLIIMNYLPHGLLGMPNNWYLLGGLGLVLVGIISATQYR